MEKQIINNYFKTWSEKLDIPISEVEEEYNKNLSLIPNEFEDKEKKALQLTLLNYKKQLRSPAIGFEGMIVACGDVIDMVRNQRNQAIELFKNDPQQAIANGICDEQGNPLDTRQAWGNGRPNQNFGKPLPQNNYFKTMYGVGRKKGGEFKQFILNVSGENAKIDYPTFKPVKFRATDRSQDDSIFILNLSSVSKVEEVQIEITPNEALKYFENMNVEFGELPTYHNTNQTNYNRLAFVKGIVSFIDLTPTTFGSRRLVLEDQDNLSLDSKNLVCWIPDRVNIDFEEGSEVIVIGRTALGKPREEGDEGDLMMNVYELLPINIIKSIEKTSDEIGDLQQDDW